MHGSKESLVNCSVSLMAKLDPIWPRPRRRLSDLGYSGSDSLVLLVCWLQPGTDSYTLAN